MSELPTASGACDKWTFRDHNIKLLCKIDVTPWLTPASHPSSCKLCSKRGESYVLDTHTRGISAGEYSLQAIDNGRASSVIFGDKGSQSRPTTTISCDPLEAKGKSATVIGDHTFNIQWCRPLSGRDEVQKSSCLGYDRNDSHSATVDRGPRTQAKGNSRGIQCAITVTPQEPAHFHSDCGLCSGTPKEFIIACDSPLPYTSKLGDDYFEADDDGTIVCLKYTSKYCKEPVNFISQPRKHFENEDAGDHTFNIRWIDKNPTVSFPFENIGDVITKYERIGEERC